MHPLSEWGVLGAQNSVDLKFHILYRAEGRAGFLSLKKQPAKNSVLTLDNWKEKQEELTSTSKNTEQKGEVERKGK